MTQAPKDKETERFYKLSYFIIPLPMIAGVLFAGYVLITEDSRNQAYCTVGKSNTVYQQSVLNEDDFISRESISLNLCKDKDDAIDDGDGIKAGRVQWFVCKGTTCGPGWQTTLSRK